MRSILPHAASIEMLRGVVESEEQIEGHQARALESKESYLLTVVDELEAIESQQRMPDTYSKLNAENVTRTIHCGAAMHIARAGRAQRCRR